VFGVTVDRVRRRIGHRLAEEHPAEADLVLAVPDSSNSIALGFSEATGIPFELGLIRNHYVGRTFIQPQPSGRDSSVRVKFNPVRESGGPTRHRGGRLDRARHHQPQVRSPQGRRERISGVAAGDAPALPASQRPGATDRALKSVEQIRDYLGGLAGYLPEDCYASATAALLPRVSRGATRSPSIPRLQAPLENNCIAPRRLARADEGRRSPAAGSRALQT
jgi:hypothetical protein